MTRQITGTIPAPSNATSQLEGPGPTAIIMRSEAHLQTPKSPAVAPARIILQINPSSSPTASMRFTTFSLGASSPTSSGASTPTSHRRSSTSSLAPQNDFSPASSSSGRVNTPIRSPMKSSLKKSVSVGASMNRQSASHIVRFSDLEPLPRGNTDSVKTNGLDTQTPLSPLRQPKTQRFSLGPHQYKPKNVRVVSLTQQSGSPTSNRRMQHQNAPRDASDSQSSSPAKPPRGPPLSHLRSGIQTQKHTDRRLSAPPTCSQLDPRLDPRWSGIPLPASFTPPTLNLTQRTTSYQSMMSNFSVQSAPPVLSTPPSTDPPKQYDPLRNYVPCMAAMCTAHYAVAHSGPAYHLPQEPYNLSRHHGYCPRHASKEMKEANSLCKREYERMRQSAGRKTLGVVAADFEIFLHLYREARVLEDARLQQTQKHVVFGTAKSTSPKDKNSVDQRCDEWNWRYTPRPCTRKNCKKSYYSPYATHLFSFYTSPRPSTGFLPLQTLCPQCANSEVEEFEQNIREKWSSRCGWNSVEWEQWYSNAKKDREMEMEFWEKAQERVIKEKKVTPKVATVKVDQEVKIVEAVEKRKRKSVFRKMFGMGPVEV